MESNGLVAENFENDIYPFSLKFKDPELEKEYMDKRIDMKLLPTTTKRLLVFLLLGHILVHVFNIATASGYNNNYTFSVRTWIVYSMMIPMYIFEFVCRKYRRLAILRGSFFTVMEIMIVVQCNFDSSVDIMFYPFTGSIAIMWSSTTAYMNMHYVLNWVVSLVSYLLAFIEIMILLFYYYGARLMTEIPAAAVLDTLFYLTVFIWFTFGSIFAARTHEFSERRSYHAKHQQKRETEEWKKLLDDIPEPVIFTRNSEIKFFNKATLGLLMPDGKGSPLGGSSERVQRSVNESQEVLQQRQPRERVMAQLANLHQKESDRTLKDVVENSVEGLARETLFTFRKESKKLSLMVKCVKTTTSRNESVIEYIIHDVTALKELERNKAKEQCFDILLATASHDIRTPLNVMLGVIDIFEDFVNTPTGKEQITVARCCGQRMLHYLKGLTLLRQINTNSVVASKKLFDPKVVARGVVGTLEFSAQSKNLYLELDVDPSVPTVMCSDKEMYAIILQNLAENSIKYTYTGGVKIHLGFDKESRSLETTIMDTGIGMNAEQMDKVGILFGKSKNRCCYNPQGLGLGLFLAKSLSQQLEGELSITSDMGKGTTARFTIVGSPNYEACLEQKIPELSTSTSMEFPISSVCDCTKVLLVDDEPFNLLVLSAYLESEMVSADRAENGKLALNLIERKLMSGKCCKGYSVIFMDINMPVMDGVKATEKIHEWVKEKRIPPCYVIAVTAAAGLDKPSVYANYVARGFTELLSKPVTRADFIRTLKKYTHMQPNGR